MIIVTVARRPVNAGSTVAVNVLDHGTGAIDIDGTRITNGRWPANLVLDPGAAAVLDRETAPTTSSPRPRHNGGRVKGTTPVTYGSFGAVTSQGFEDEGGPSRYFRVVNDAAP